MAEDEPNAPQNVRSADSEEMIKRTEESEQLPTESIFNNNHLFVQVQEHQWPIVYRKEYNIGFLGLQKLHPFDSGKWGKIFQFLKDENMVTDDTVVCPEEPTEEDLMVIHEKSYLNTLKVNIAEAVPEWSITVAGITEVPPVVLLPNFIVQRKVLKPLRFQTGGTVLAAKLAVERGWAINLGGGFHHCSSSRGGGFCAYADISLGIKFLLEMKLIQKAMIVDLDAHQGNGHARDFINMRNQVYILDVYNRSIYPHDGYAKRGITRRVELEPYTQDATFLHLVKSHLEEAVNEFQPDIIFYNAGTDCLEGDPLGVLSVSPQGVIKRDEIVFECARQKHSIAIVMVTSGGYQQMNAKIISQSILNLRQKNLISCPAAEEYIQAKRFYGEPGGLLTLNYTIINSYPGFVHFSDDKIQALFKDFSRMNFFVQEISSGY